VQIYTGNGAKNKFSPQFSANFLAGARLFVLPRISEEGFDIGARDGLSGNFFEAGHQHLHVFDGNPFPCPMVEPGVDFLGRYRLLFHTTLLFGG
jgi:hypothetical protein